MKYTTLFLLACLLRNCACASGHNGGEDMNGNIRNTECTELADASRFLGGGWVSDDEEFDDDFGEDSDEDMVMEDASSAQEVQLDETVENVPQMQSTATAANPVVSNSERKSDTTRNKLRQRKIHRYSKKPLTPSPSIPRPASKARCVSCTAKGVQCDDAGQGCTNCREMGIKCQYPWDIDALRLGNLPKLTAEQEIELAALKNLIEKEKTEHPTTQGQGQRSKHNKKCASCKSLSLKCEPLGAPCTRCQTLGVRCRYSWQHAGKWYMLRELTKAEEKLLNPRAELDRERNEQLRNNHQDMRIWEHETRLAQRVIAAELNKQRQKAPQRDNEYSEHSTGHKESVIGMVLQKQKQQRDTSGPNSSV